MSTNTYVALDKVTVGTATATVTFTGINQGYTDLRIIVNGGIDTADNNTFFRVGNGSIDSGSNYSDTFVDSRGTSTPGSGRHLSATRMQLDYYGSMSTTNSTLTIDLMGYSNTTTNKTLLSRFGNTTSTSYSGTGAMTGTWHSTNAINTIQFSLDSTAKFNAGTTFSLYGIKSWAAEVTPKATGGYVYSDSTYWYHAFPFSSTFTPNQSITADVLVVAGGGGGGNAGDRGAGGGGAGGLLAYTSQALTATNYPITVGAGGARLTSAYASNGFQGTNSQFASLTASVGGGGGGCESTYLAGDSGGSGGGGGANSTLRGLGGSQTSGQGNPGGNGYFPGGTSNDSNGGGGGGAGAAGGNAASGYVNGTGGVGSSAYSSWGLATNTGENISGTVYYAGGGGGAGGGGSTNNNAKALGGYGGGAAGNSLANDFAPNALVSTGGGGGGQSWNGSSGAGGSGIIIVRYAK